MTDQEYLNFLRRRLRDVDPSAPTYSDTVMWEYTQDALRMLVVRKVSGLDGYTVAVTTPLGVTPDLSDEDGLLLATKTAYMLLGDLYTERVRSGELGVIWESGLERESSIDLRKAYESDLQELELEINELLLLRYSQTFAKRMQ